MTTALSTEEVTTEAPYPALTASDRSDASASYAVQALVRVAKDGRDLLLDGHTYAVNEAALLVDGWEVIEDARERFLNPPKTAFDSSDH